MEATNSYNILAVGWNNWSYLLSFSVLSQYSWCFSLEKIKYQILEMLKPLSQFLFCLIAFLYSYNLQESLLTNVSSRNLCTDIYENTEWKIKLAECSKTLQYIPIGKHMNIPFDFPYRQYAKLISINILAISFKFGCLKMCALTGRLKSQRS